MATNITHHLILSGQGVPIEMYINDQNSIFVVNQDDERFFFVIHKDDWEEVKKFIDEQFENLNK